MARTKKKIMGLGAKVSVFMKYLHPSEHIRQRFPNAEKNHHLTGCIIKGKDEKTVNRRKQKVILIEHDDFKKDGDPILLYATYRWFTVTEEGPKEGFFETVTQEEAFDNPLSEEFFPEETPEAAFRIDKNIQISDGDLAEISDAIGIDNDNEPAPENIPKTNEIINSVFKEWGHDGICFRRVNDVNNVSAKLKN